MKRFDLSEANTGIEDLCERIDEHQGIMKQFIGYFNDPMDLDKVGCFV
jgi:hypothetical protein